MQWWQRLLGVAVVLLLLWKISCLLVVVEERSSALSSLGKDRDASLVNLPPGEDKRGWLLNPLQAAARAGLSGGAVECTSVHAGEIRAGGVRANHRHHYCNETFLLWNARALFRLENAFMERGYAQAIVEAGEVSVATAGAGRGHAVANIDRHKTLYFLACQDAVFKPQYPMTDFEIWADLRGENN